MSEQEPSGGDVYYYGPLIEFDTDDPEFVRGAEFGAVQERLSLKRQEEVEQLMHRSNEEMVKRLAHAYGREYSVEILDDNYMVVVFGLSTQPNIMDAMNHPTN